MQEGNYPIFAEVANFVPWHIDAMDESAFIEWMRERLAVTGISQTALAKAVGLPAQSAVSNILNGSRRVKLDERVKIEKALGGEEISAEQSPIVWVPVIGLASAGAWREAVEIPSYSMPMRRKPHCNMAFAVEVRGDSMDKILPEGGWAVVDPDQRTLYEGKVYLIGNHEFEATIKRYHNNPARFEPVSHNPMHSTIMMGEHQITVIGRIVSYGNDDGL